MQQFEYLAVLISIVLGLGITQLLSGFARWLEQRSAFKLYGPSIMWAGVLLLVHVQTWWSMFGMRDHEGWTFVQFSVVLMQPILLFLLATLVLPSATAPHHDLRTNYFAQRRWFFGLLAGLLATSVTKDVALDGELPDAVNLGFHAYLFAMSIAAMMTAREWFHRLLAFSSVAFFVIYITLLFARLA